MAKYIPLESLVAEIKKYKDSFCDRNGYLEDPETNGLVYDTFCELEDSIDTLEVKEADLENYNKVKKVLSLSFMHFLDANRPEGKMCLSNGECFDIEKAFDELDFSKLFRYMEKYLKAQKGE